MNGKKTLLLLRLEGALQSWGDHSKWDTRDTGAFPSKSGILGLLACALGWERGDDRIAALSASMTVAVRADRPGELMMDFHTVQGNPRLTTADGKPRAANQSTIVSKRWYLQDASFLAAVDVGEPWTEMVAQALSSPKWPLFLGRKNCVPSRPVLEEISTDYSDVMDAVLHHPALRREGTSIPPCGLQYECEGFRTGAASYTRADDRRSGGRDFALRRVYSGVVPKEVGDDSDKN